MNIYELNRAIEDVEYKIEQYAIEHDGEISEELENEEKVLFEGLEDKHEAYAIVIKNKIAFEKALKDEKKNIDARIKTNSSSIERLKKTLSESLNGEKYETTKVKIGWRKSTAVNILDEEQIEAKYLKTKTTISVDKTSIKKDLSSGVEVAGAELLTNQNIQIK